MGSLVLILSSSLLLCGLLVWLVGRSMTRDLDDPALDERFYRYRGQTLLWSWLLGLMLPVVVVFLRNDAPWPMVKHPLFALVILACVMLHATAAFFGAWPVRRAVLQERMGALASFAFSVRFLFAFSGFWLVFLLTPYLIQLSGSYQLLAAGSMFVLLMAWSFGFQRVTSFLIGSEPLTDPVMRDRFALVWANARVAPPEVRVFAPEAGNFTNAFALPALAGSRILMSRPLLRTLSLEESAAIFGHEVAHLEEHDLKKMKRLGLINLLAIVVGCASVPVFSRLVPGWVDAIHWVWPFVLLIFLSARLQGQKGHEVESDRRAVDLCGNPEALIMALTKIHQANRMPRRIEIEAEQLATHPSLARRIQAIREHVGVPETENEPSSETSQAPEETAAARSWLFVHPRKPTELVVFEQRRIVWLAMDPSSQEAPLPSGPVDPERVARLRNDALRLRSSAYRDLMELRLAVKGKRYELRAVDSVQGRTVFPVSKPDVAEIQRRLDQIDIQFAPVKNMGYHGLAALVSFAIGFGGFLASIQGIFSAGTAIWLLLGCVLAAATRQRTWVSALGAMALAAAVFAFWFQTDKSWWITSHWLFLTIIGLCGIWCLWRAPRLDQPLRQPLPEASARVVALVYGVLGGLFLVPSLLTFADGETLARCYSFAVDSHGKSLPFLAAAGALRFQNGRFTAGIMAALVLYSAVHLAVGTETYLARVARDPLVRRMPGPNTQTVPYVVSKRAFLEGGYWDLRISPHGKRFMATATSDWNAGLYERDFYVIDFAGKERLTIRAMQVRFVDDDRLLVLIQTMTESELRLIPADDPQTVLWRLPLAVPGPAGLDLRVHGERWEVISGRDLGVTLRLRGVLGAEAVTRQTWTRTEELNRNRAFGPGDRVLQVTHGQVPRGAGMSRDRFRWLFANYYQPSRLSFFDEASSEELAYSALWVDVLEPFGDHPAWMCLAYGGHHAWLWQIDPSAGTLEPLIQIGYPMRWSWQAGRLAMIDRQSRLRVVDPFSGRGVLIELPHKVDWRLQFASCGNRVLLGWPRDDDSGYDLALLELEWPADETEPGKEMNPP